MITKYNNFILIKEQQTQPIKGQLFIEGDGEYEEKWTLILDISNIWFDQENVDNVSDFNKKYANYLNTNSQIILDSIGQECWNEISPVIKELNETQKKEDSFGIWESLYNIYDKYDIYLKTNKS